MMKHIIYMAIAATSVLAAATQARAEEAKNVLDLKHSITDSNIVYPDSYEVDTRKMLEGWYLKNYTATDTRYSDQSDANVSDDVIRERLSKLNTVIEMPFNQIVRSYIDRYTARGRGAVSTLLGLSIYYMPIFEQALEAQGLPLELKYLPVIESGLNPNAVSKHGATGLWQFMLATGKGLDLEVSSLVDERRDPYASSQKAAAYLKDLYDTYKDWSLAIAAYNCGPGTVNKAIRRAGGDPASHDFWSIYYYLPAETRGYVPMFIAANYVMNYYPYHNISPVLATKPLVTDTLMISNRVHFNQISKVLDIPVDELRVLNPQFRADIIPGNPERMYTLVLPSQQIHAYIMSEDAILAYEADKYTRRTDATPGDQPDADTSAAIEADATAMANEPADDAPLEPAPVQEAPPVRKASSKTTASTHKVEPGETLASIARQHGVTVEELKQWNNLTRSSVRTGQMLRVSAETKASTQLSRQATAQADKKTSPAKTKSGTASTGKGKNNRKTQPARTLSHTVKSGENLTVIAKKYGVSVDELKKANNLKGDELHPGDNLKVPSKAKASGSSRKKSKASSSKKSGGKSKSSGKGKKRRR